MSVPFIDAGPGQCRRPLWPLTERIGDVCGEPAKVGSAYCPACHAIVYVPATRSRVSAIQMAVDKMVRDRARHQPAPNIHPEFEETK